MNWYWNSKPWREYRRKRGVWERSLTQETYTVAEAAKAMQMGETTVRNLIDAGELQATKKSERHTVITREAIIDYMVPRPRGLLDFFQ